MRIEPREFWERNCFLIIFKSKIVLPIYGYVQMNIDLKQSFQRNFSWYRILLFIRIIQKNLKVYNEWRKDFLIQQKTWFSTSRYLFLVFGSKRRFLIFDITVFIFICWLEKAVSYFSTRHLFNHVFCFEIHYLTFESKLSFLHNFWHNFYVKNFVFLLFHIFY